MANKTGMITITDGIDKYVQDLQLRNYSTLTIYGYQKRLALFQQWAEERVLNLATSITEAHLDCYRRYLHQYTYGGKRIKAATQKGHLLVIKQYFT